MFFPIWTPKIKSANSISTLEQVEINGGGHEIMIRGNDKANPVIIVVHGGPGSPETPYANKYYDLLEANFTIVNYDQRASGKSYHPFEDYSNLSADLLVEDLLAVTDYISERLGKEKVILMGHSFGTYIGIQAAHRSPEKYLGYVGVGQVSDMVESETEILDYCIHQAQKASNTDDVTDLKGLAEQIKNGDIVTPRNYVVKYGGSTRLIGSPDSGNIGVLLSSEYNLFDLIRYNYGMGYSQKILVDEILENPVPNIVEKVEIPLYFVMGRYDYMTTSNAAKNTLIRSKRNKKNLFLLKNWLIILKLKKKRGFMNG